MREHSYSYTRISMYTCIHAYYVFVCSLNGSEITCNAILRNVVHESMYVRMYVHMRMYMYITTYVYMYTYMSNTNMYMSMLMQI